MKKRLLALTLAGALLLGTAPTLAAEEKFPAVKDYPGYGDVKETDWFYDNAKLCYEIGLMTGTDQGFEPNKVLTKAECVTLAARVGAILRGEAIPEGMPGDPWWGRYNRYVFAPWGGGIDGPDDPARRWQFLSFIYNYVKEAGLLTPINHIEVLEADPDFGDDVGVLDFYNAGILTGVDEYGTFGGDKSLTRAEAAAMVARIARPELRKSFVPKSYAPFTAAYLTPTTVMFSNGVTAQTFLDALCQVLTDMEDALAREGKDFNWHLDLGGGQTVLKAVKARTLERVGAAEKDGTQAYKDFDYQVFYARLIDLTGAPLGSAGGLA